MGSVRTAAASLLRESGAAGACFGSGYGLLKHVLKDSHFSISEALSLQVHTSDAWPLRDVVLEPEHGAEFSMHCQNISCRFCTSNPQDAFETISPKNSFQGCSWSLWHSSHGTNRLILQSVILDISIQKVDICRRIKHLQLTVIGSLGNMVMSNRATKFVARATKPQDF